MDKPEIISLGKYRWAIWCAADGHWRVRDEITEEHTYHEFDTPDQALHHIKTQITEHAKSVPRLNGYDPDQKWRQSLKPMNLNKGGC